MDKTFYEIHEDLVKEYGDSFSNAFIEIEKVTEHNYPDGPITFSMLAGLIAKYGIDVTVIALLANVHEYVEMNRILTMPETELDAELRTMGIDPKEAQQIVANSIRTAIIQADFRFKDKKRLKDKIIRNDD